MTDLFLIQCTVENPKIETPYGFLCFGDLELRRGRALLVTAMSDLRMQVMLDALHELVGDRLDRPRMTYDPVHGIDKKTGKQTKKPSRD